jgi:PKD repeat protein
MATSYNECSQTVNTKQMKKSLVSLLMLVVGSTTLFAQDSISVLFVGNSYVYVNDLPGTISQLAASLGKTVTTGQKVNGAYTFANHAADPLTYSAMHQQMWDVVVIQGQSQEPSFPTDQVNTQSLPYAIQLTDSVYAANPCGNAMFFMTWGREVGDPQWDSINTFDKMNGRLYDAYMKIARESNAMVSPVGAVWKYVRDHYPSIGLYNADGSHPSLAGTYLAACTFYTSLFESSPVGASFLGGLDATTAAQLQSAAQVVIMDSLDHFRIHAVNAPTQANFELVQTGNTIQLTDQSVRASQLNWDLGDATTAISTGLSHTYATNGSYVIQLIASSVCNADTMVQTIQITTASINQLAAAGISLHTFTDHYELQSDSPFQYALYSENGQLIATEKQLETNNLVVKKSSSVFLVWIKKGDFEGLLKLID